MYTIIIQSKIKAGLSFALDRIICSHAFIYQMINYHLHMAYQDQGTTKWDIYVYSFNRQTKDIWFNDCQHIIFHAFQNSFSLRGK